MKKQQKIFFVDNLVAELKSAKSIVLVNYAGMDNKTQQELKKKLKEVGSKMLVAKNTLLKLAGQKAGVDENALTDTVLVGQNALILASDDPIAPLQVIAKFAKEHEVPQLRVGIIDGSFQDTEVLIKLSTLPGRDALLGQLLGAVMAPEYGLVATLQANLQKLVYILDQKAKS